MVGALPTAARSGATWRGLDAGAVMGFPPEDGELTAVILGAFTATLSQHYCILAGYYALPQHKTHKLDARRSRSISIQLYEGWPGAYFKRFFEWQLQS